jgi:predicted nucleic acid-binding Zn ribbon protein
MQCQFCGQEINDVALICPFCRKDQPAERRRKRSKRLVIFMICGGAFVTIILIAAMSAPRNYKDIAADYARDCMLNKGWGHWAGSDAISLEQFCDAAGNLHVLHQARMEHPEQF